MKKLVTTFMLFVLCFNSAGAVFAAPVALSAATTAQVKKIEYKPSAKTIEYAFIFDGPSPKNDAILKQFEKTITISTAPDYKAKFSPGNVFVGNWTEQSVASASDKALSSKATMIVSLGYLSTKYLNAKPNKSKFVVTIDQYGLRDMGESFFNPVQQSVKGVLLFKRLIPFNKTAILMNDCFYKTKKDWDSFLRPKLIGTDFKVIPVNNANITEVLGEVSKGYDSVVFTPLFNLTPENKKSLITQISAKKLPTFSTLGREDVVDGVLLGTGAYDLDRKIAEATSFSVVKVLNGDKNQQKQIQFYEDDIIYVNSDTAETIGYDPQLRLLNNAEIISNKPSKVYDLSAVFDTLGKQNLDIERKKLLVKAARRASLSAMLRYLPTFSVTMGYQSYNHDFADSAKMTTPQRTGIFSTGLEQVIYSPALVTNILVKKKMVDFTKQEQIMTEQNIGMDIALLYIEDLIINNMLTVQKEQVKEARENLAIARVREKMGKCGREEALRWAAQVSVSEQHLLNMTSEAKNINVAINKLLFNTQTDKFMVAPLKATDPAFYTSEIHIIDYVRTPAALEKFTQMLVQQSYDVAPELSKLNAAIKMKDYEMAMYYQKFFLPDAKLNLDYTSLGNRHFTGPTIIPADDIRYAGVQPINMAKPDATNLRFAMFAQWKPIEGGTKFAEIARIKAEREELQRYQDEVKTSIEEHVRQTINRALAGYFSIEKNYKAMYAAQESYVNVKNKYLRGEAPIAQVLDSQHMYLEAKINAMNSQYVFFKELFWVQRAICSVDWTKATPEAKDFINRVKKELERKDDVELL